MNTLKIAGSGLLILLIMSGCSSSKNTRANSNMLVAKMQVDEPISGVCDNSNVIAVLPIPGNGQLEAIGSLNDEQIQKKLNEEVTFLADKPGYRDKGMVRLIISCRGQLVQCVIDNKTQYPELDQQIVAVFSQLDEWQAGSINGRSVDTVKLYSFEIKNGIITL